MRAGTLRYTITLIQSILTTDDFGAKTETWGVYSTIRAGILYKGGNKTIQDHERFNTSNVDFTCRYDSLINEQMRIVFDNKVYKISNINRNPFDNSLIISSELISGESTPILITTTTTTTETPTTTTTTTLSSGDSGHDKGDWSVDSPYYPYKQGDVVNYYYNLYEEVYVTGTFLANFDNNVAPNDSINGSWNDYPNSYWTLISNNHSNTGRNWPEPTGSEGIGKGNFTSYLFPYNMGDIVYYNNGGLYGSFISMIVNNSEYPDDYTTGYNTDIKHWDVIKIDLYL